MAVIENTYIVGRGEVYFDLFDLGTTAGQGERYIGNTPEYQIERTVERLSKWTSVNGTKIEVPGSVLSESHVISISTDNISLENLGLFFGSEAQTIVLPGENLLDETFVVRQCRYYQLGKSYSITGVRAVVHTTVYINGASIPSAENWELDSDNGRLYILDGALQIADGATIDVNFEWRANTTGEVVSDPVDRFGALRFVAYNAVGPQINYLFPCVRIAPRTQIDLKGDTWQVIPIQASAQNLTPGLSQMYTYETLSIGYTQDEQAIIDNGITLEDFPFYEDELNTIVNVQIPSYNF